MIVLTIKEPTIPKLSRDLLDEFCSDIIGLVFHPSPAQPPSGPPRKWSNSAKPMAQTENVNLLAQMRP